MDANSLKIIHLIDRLSRFFFIARGYGNALHKSRDITTGQRSVLMEVAHFENRTVNQMAQQRRISKQAIQKTVDSLVERSLLKKVVPDWDRRARALELTDEGRVLLKDIYAAELSELQTLLPLAEGIEADAVIATVDRLEEILIERSSALKEQAN